MPALTASKTATLPSVTDFLLQAPTLLAASPADPGPGDSCNDINNCRTRLQIIWSCIAVLVACTWASIHPNVPGPKDSWWKVLRRKIGLMLLCLLAPELLVMWAARQWVSAWMLWNRYRHRGWTVTHAMFALMGGFALYQGDHLVSVLRFRPVEIRGSPESRKILRHFRNPGTDNENIYFDERSFAAHVDFIGHIPEHEIKERSRVDWFGKLIAIGQTSWFIAHLIARWAQGLAVTELETMTVAFATMNFILYYFWWNKPLEVVHHIRIQTVRQTFVIEMVEDRNGSESVAPSLFSEQLPVLLRIALKLAQYSFRDLFRQVVSPVGIAASSLRTWLSQLFQQNQSSLETSLYSIIQWPIQCGKSIRTHLRKVPGKLDESMSEVGLQPGGSVKRIFWAISYTIGGPFHVLFKATAADKGPPHRILSFEHDLESFNKFSLMTDVYLPFGAASSFGAIHCAAWNFLFPTELERSLWRMSSVTITYVPFTVLILPFLISFFPYANILEEMKHPEKSNNVLKSFLYSGLRLLSSVLGAGSITLYTGARLDLIVQSFLALRDLPHSALQGVSWTNFIPHI